MFGAGIRVFWVAFGFLLICLVVEVPLTSLSQNSSGVIAAGAGAINAPARLTATNHQPPRISLPGGLPLTFEENIGQIDATIKYRSRCNGYDVALQAEEAVLRLRIADVKSRNAESLVASSDLPDPQSAIIYSPALLRLKLPGASPKAKIVALDKLATRTNYFIGSDKRKWKTDVPNYRRIKYQNVYPGVDLEFHGSGGDLEYDFIVAPGANPGAITFSYDGAIGPIRTDKAGDLIINAAAGEVRQKRPVCYQNRGDVKERVASEYAVARNQQITFNLADYDSTLPLIIDPVLVYSTSLGGVSNDAATGVAMDSAGNAYVIGTTSSPDFPTANAFQPGPHGTPPSESFILKLNPAGTSVIYSTYLGGSSADVANAIAVDANGNAYVTGYTLSDDFPTTANAFQTRRSSGGDAFVVKLNPTGNALAYSTRLGGDGLAFGMPASNVGRAIVVDSHNNAYVAGHTFSASFPLRRPAQREFNAGNPFDCCGCLYFFAPAPSPPEDAFVAKLNLTGDGLEYSTYLGGAGQDESLALAVDEAGSAYLAGRTCSPGFVSPAAAGSVDAFVAKLTPSGREIQYLLPLGGNGFDAAVGLTLDRSGNAFVTGTTGSIDFPTNSTAIARNLNGSVAHITNDSGASWEPVRDLPNLQLNAISIDHGNSQKLFAGYFTGLFTSSDGGLSWSRVLLPNSFIGGVAVDPHNSSRVFAGLSRSTNGGQTWTSIAGVTPGCGKSRFLFDSSDPSIVYDFFEGGVCGDVGTLSQLYKSVDGGVIWRALRRGTNPFAPSSVAVDETNPTTLFATLAGDLVKSTDRGETWAATHAGHQGFSKVVVDPISSNVLYLLNLSRQLFKSTDGGATFSLLDRLVVPLAESINDLVVDPASSSTIYVATGSSGMFGGGVTKSTDGGLTWNQTDLTAVHVTSIVVDPNHTSRIFATALPDVDSFVAKIKPNGSGLEYSTYLGTRSRDIAAGIGIDEIGNAYIAGTTLSDRLSVFNVIQSTKGTSVMDPSIFAMKIDPSGSALLFSTYLGGTSPANASAVAVDNAGRFIVAGNTGVPAVPPPGNRGQEVFVAKIVSPPRITEVSVSGKNLVVTGEGFDGSAVILVDGVEQNTRHDEVMPSTRLIGKKTVKRLTIGQSVEVRVRNSDGMLSNSVPFIRH